MSYPVVDWNKKEVEQVELPEILESIELNKGLLHQVVISQLAAMRSGTSKTKGRSEIAGTGKKPFKQKGTGNARQGSKKVPHFVGGGKAFGPHPRDYSKKINKKVKVKALQMALSTHVKAKSLVLLNEADPGSHKTKDFSAKLDGFGEGKSLLVIEECKNLGLAARNLKKTKMISVSQLNIFDILKAQQIFFDKNTWNQVAERIG